MFYMSDDQKIKPQVASGTVNLPSQPPIEIGKDAVANNNSNKSSEEFVKALEEAAKDNVFIQEDSK